MLKINKTNGDPSRSCNSKRGNASPDLSRNLSLKVSRFYYLNSDTSKVLFKIGNGNYLRRFAITTRDAKMSAEH